MEKTWNIFSWNGDNEVYDGPLIDAMVNPFCNTFTVSLADAAEIIAQEYDEIPEDNFEAALLEAMRWAEAHSRKIGIPIVAGWQRLAPTVYAEYLKRRGPESTGVCLSRSVAGLAASEGLTALAVSKFEVAR
jgi:hypothetical protein